MEPVVVVCSPVPVVDNQVGLLRVVEDTLVRVVVDNLGMVPGHVTGNPVQSEVGNLVPAHHLEVLVVYRCQQEGSLVLGLVLSMVGVVH